MYCKCTLDRRKDKYTNIDYQTTWAKYICKETIGLTAATEDQEEIPEENSEEYLAEVVVEMEDSQVIEI